MGLAAGIIRAVALYAVYLILATAVLYGFALVAIPALRSFMTVTGLGGLAAFLVLTLGLLLAISLQQKR